MVLQIRKTMVLKGVELDGKSQISAFLDVRVGNCLDGEAWFCRKTSEIGVISPVLPSCTSLPRRAKVSFDCCSLLHGSQLHGRSLTAGPTSKHVRRTSCSSAGGLAEDHRESRSDRDALLAWWLHLCYTPGCWEELGAMGDTGKTNVQNTSSRAHLVRGAAPV